MKYAWLCLSLAFVLCNVIDIYQKLSVVCFNKGRCKTVVIFSTCVHTTETNDRRSVRAKILICSQGFVRGNLTIGMRIFLCPSNSSKNKVGFGHVVSVSRVCQLWFVKTGIKCWPLLFGPNNTRSSCPPNCGWQSTALFSTCSPHTLCTVIGWGWHTHCPKVDTSQIQKTKEMQRESEQSLYRYRHHSTNCDGSFVMTVCSCIIYFFKETITLSFKFLCLISIA